MDLAARLGAFVDARRPGWSSRVAGASETEITALEHALVTPFRFPASYRATLAAFGRDDDGLLDKLQYTLGSIRSLPALATYYASLAFDAFDALDPALPPVLVDNLGNHVAFDLASGQAEPALLFEDGKPFADSWESLVFIHAARELDRELPSTWVTASPKALAGRDVPSLLDAIAATHGFAVAAFSDRTHRYLVRDGGSLWISMTHGIGIDVSGNAGPLAPTLAAQLGGRHIASS